MTMLFSCVGITAMAEETPEKGYILTVYSEGDPFVIDAEKSASAFNLKTALEDAYVFIDTPWMSGVSGTPSIVIDMYEDSQYAEMVELKYATTINGNGHKITYTGEGNAYTGIAPTLNDVTFVNENETETQPTAVGNYDELVAALANGGEIILNDNITTEAAIVTSGITATINLNGNTLKIGAGDNKFNDESNITIKNGNIDIDGVDVGGNAIFCLDEYEKTLATTLTLEDVNLTGDGYDSAYGVFYIGSSSVLNVNGGVWNLSNDTHTSGGVFKADDSNATLNITGTDMTLHNVRRVVTYAATEIKDSTITVTGDADGVDAEMEHGFNRSPLVIDNSTITMTDMVGRGITAQNGAVEIKNGSTVTITNAQEATIDVRDGQTVTISEDSTVTVDAAPIISSGKIDGDIEKSPAGPVEVDTYEKLVEALEVDNANIIMTADITATATQNSGYGKAGIVLDAGDVLDGNGKTLTINDANSTWDCVIAMRGGEVKNLTIAGAMRGVFMPGANGDVVINNCVFKDVIYTFNSDAGSKDYSVTIKNTTLNGWTSFSNVHKSVTFESCEFGEGSGYAFCRPYNNAEFVKCEFNAGFEVDAIRTATPLAFNDCTYAGETLTAENGGNMFGAGSVVIDGETVSFNRVAQIGETTYTSFQDAIAAAKAGDTIKLLADAHIAEGTDVTLPAGITLNGNGFSIFASGADHDTTTNYGYVIAGGNLTIEGITKIEKFSAGYYDRTITIGEGASLDVFGKNRVTLAYGNVFNITGTISDAKTADKAETLASLIIPAGISITGSNDAAMNVKNAYVSIGSTTTKNSSTSGTIKLNFENSIAEFTNQLTFSEPTNGMNPTFNVNVKDSVLTTATKLCIAAPNTTMVVDNSTVNLGSYIRNSGELTLKNGSTLTGSTIQFGENGGNDGTIIVDRSVLTVNASSEGHAFDGKGTGLIVVKNGSTATITYLKDSYYDVDSTSTLNATLIGCTEYKVSVAEINGVGYETLQAALDAVENGEIITLLQNVTVTTPAYGENALNYAKAVNCTIDLGGYTVSADTGNSVFRFNISGTGAMENVTVTLKNGEVISGDNTWCAITATGMSENVKMILNLENVDVKNSRGYDFGVKSWANAVVNAKDVNVEATKQAGGFYAVGGEIVLDNCTVIQEGLYSSPWTSMAFGVSGGGKLTVNSGEYSAKPTSAEEGNGQGTTHGSWTGGVMNSGGTLIINGGTFTNGNFGDVAATAPRGVIVVDAGANLEINGGTFNGMAQIIDYTNNLGDASKNPVVTIKGGTYSANPESNWVKLPDSYSALPDLNGNYIVGVKPTATVDNLGSAVVRAGDYYNYGGGGNAVDMPLSFVMQFVADETAEAGAASPYAEWYADFTISVTGLKDGYFVADGCYLAGNYGSFGWWKVPIDGLKVEDGVVYPVMLSVANGAQLYEYICSGVENFKCAMYLTPEVLEANPDLKVTLSLVLVDSSKGADGAIEAITTEENCYVVEKTTYDNEEFMIEYVAEIDGVKYLSLQDAIDEAEADDTITLLEDIELEEGITIPADKTITLDLAGYTITGAPAESAAYAVITNKGNLTVEDSVGGGKILCDHQLTGSTSYAVNTITNAGTLTVNGGVIENTSTASNQIGYAIDNNSTTGNAVVTVNGGEIKASGSNYYDGIRQFCNSTTLENSVIVNDGSVSSIWMQNPSDGASDKNTKDVKGSVTVNGGTVTALYLEPSTSFEAAVTGGNIGTLAHFQKSEGRDLAGFVSGGTFTNKPEDVFAIDGFEFKQNADGTYGVKKVELFDLYAANVTLGNSLAMNFAINMSDIMGTDYYAEIKHYAESEVKTIKVDFADWTIDSTGKYYVVTYSGLTAKQIVDDLEVTIYRNDDTQVSNVWEDGLKAYALRMMEKTLDKASLTEKDNELLIVLADMLNYGAAAQREFSYKVDTLATDGVDEKYMAYASEMPEISDVSERDSEICFGSTLSLKDSIVLKAAFKGVSEGMYATVSFTKHNGKTDFFETITYADMEKSGSYVIINVDDLVIADAKQVVTITIYDANGNVYTVFKDSMNSYIKRNIDDGDASRILEMTAKFTSSAYNTLH